MIGRCPDKLRLGVFHNGKRHKFFKIHLKTVSDDATIKQADHISKKYINQIVTRGKLSEAEINEKFLTDKLTTHQSVHCVAGLHEYPHLSSWLTPEQWEIFRARDQEQQEYLFLTLLAGIGASGINLGGTALVIEANGWDKMVEQQRMSDDHRVLLGMDKTNYTETHAAGNAVVPKVTQWMAKQLIETF